MFIILTISSFTFFLRGTLDCLFIFEVIVLDFEWFLPPPVTSSENANGNMHFIGSHLYASYALSVLLILQNDVLLLLLLLDGNLPIVHPSSLHVYSPPARSEGSKHARCHLVAHPLLITAAECVLAVQRKSGLQSLALQRRRQYEAGRDHFGLSMTISYYRRSRALTRSASSCRRTSTRRRFCNIVGCLEETPINTCNQ